MSKSSGSGEVGAAVARPGEGSQAGGLERLAGGDGVRAGAQGGQAHAPRAEARDRRPQGAAGGVVLGHGVPVVAVVVGRAGEASEGRAAQRHRGSEAAVGGVQGGRQELAFARTRPTRRRATRSS